MGERREELEFEPERDKHPVRTAFAIVLAVLLVLAGYVAVIVVGGEALRAAPFGRFILEARSELEQLFGFEPPEVVLPPLQDVIQPTLPSPFVAPEPSPSPAPVPSPISVPDEPSVITFTIDFENNTGVMLTGVRLVNPLPAGTAYRTSRPAGSFDGQQVTWNLGTLAIGERGRVILELATRRRGVVRNRATMISEEAPPSGVESSVTIP